MRNKSSRKAIMTNARAEIGAMPQAGIFEGVGQGVVNTRPDLQAIYNCVTKRRPSCG